MILTEQQKKNCALLAHYLEYEIEDEQYDHQTLPLVDGCGCALAHAETVFSRAIISNDCRFGEFAFGEIFSIDSGIKTRINAVEALGVYVDKYSESAS